MTIKTAIAELRCCHVLRLAYTIHSDEVIDHVRDTAALVKDPRLQPVFYTRDDDGSSAVAWVPPEIDQTLKKLLSTANRRPLIPDIRGRDMRPSEGAPNPFDIANSLRGEHFVPSLLDKANNLLKQYGWPGQFIMDDHHLTYVVEPERDYSPPLQGRARLTIVDPPEGHAS